MRDAETEVKNLLEKSKNVFKFLKPLKTRKEMLKVEEMEGYLGLSNNTVIGEKYGRITWRRSRMKRMSETIQEKLM